MGLGGSEKYQAGVKQQPAGGAVSGNIILPSPPRSVTASFFDRDLFNLNYQPPRASGSSV